MSAVDLGGSSSRFQALKKGEVDVSGSFVRSRHDPKAWPRGHNNTWAQVHQPDRADSSARVELSPIHAAEAPAMTATAGRPTAGTGIERREELSDSSQENSHPESGQSKGARGTVTAADSPDYGE